MSADRSRLWKEGQRAGRTVADSFGMDLSVGLDDAERVAARIADDARDEPDKRLPRQAAPDVPLVRDGQVGAQDVVRREPRPGADKVGGGGGERAGPEGRGAVALDPGG